MRKQNWISFGTIALLCALCALGALYMFCPYLFSTSYWWYNPEIIGHIDVKAGIEEGRWVVRPGSQVPIELSFHTRKGTAKGLTIILELGDLDLLDASADWRVREGRYLWRYTTVREGTINLTVQIAIAQGVEHNVRLWYAYTNEDPVSIENQTILTSLEPPEYKPERETRGTLLRPFLVVVLASSVVGQSSWGQESFQPDGGILCFSSSLGPMDLWVGRDLDKYLLSVG